MTNQEIEHVKGCKELLRECAARVGLSVTLDEYQYGDKFIPAIDILLRDREGYLICKSHTGSVSEIIGFIKGLQSTYVIPICSDLVLESITK